MLQSIEKLQFDQIYFQPKQLTKYPFLFENGKQYFNGYFSAPHWHDCIEILYFNFGDAKLFLGNQWHDMKKGSLAVLNSREVHGVFIPKGEDIRHFSIGLETEYVIPASHTLYRLEYAQPFIHLLNPGKKIIPGDEIAKSPIPQLIENIKAAFEKKEYGFELFINISIYQIIFWLISYWGRHAKGEQNYSVVLFHQQNLQKVINYVEKHYSENITAQYMARFCNFSYSYFCRFFKRNTGYKFTQYLNFVRVTEAEKLLAMTDKSIVEIAQETGFADASYFIKYFKLIKNISPGQYRSTMIKKVEN